MFAEEYTLENLIEIGLEKSIGIQKEELSNKNYSSCLRSSFIDLLPSLNMYADQYKTNDADWVKSSSLSFGKTFSVNDPYNEPAFFSIYKAVNSKKRANLSLEQKRKQIVYNIFSKYLYVLEAQKNLEIRRKNLELQQKIFSQIQVQYESGEKSLLELKQSEISMIDYQIAVGESEDNLNSTRNSLFAYLNINDKGYSFIEPKISNKSMKFTFTNNLEIQMLKYAVKNCKLNLIKNSLHYLPDLSLSYYVYNTNPSNSNYTPFDEYVKSKTLTLSASFSVFDIFEESESFFRNKRNYKILKLGLQELKRDTEYRFDELEKRIETLSKSKKLYENKMQLAENNLEMAQEQFKLGLISLLDLDRTKIDHQNAQLSFNNKYYELLRKQEEINLLLSKQIFNRW